MDKRLLVFGKDMIDHSDELRSKFGASFAPVRVDRWTFDAIENIFEFAPVCFRLFFDKGGLPRTPSDEETTRFHGKFERHAFGIAG